MADQYCDSRDRAPHGPFSATQMRQLALDRYIQWTDAVWTEGIEQSVAAARVKNLFAGPPPPAAPVAAEPPPEAEPASPAAATDSPPVAVAAEPVPLRPGRPRRPARSGWFPSRGRCSWARTGRR
jgi:hypothetical protein